jgi:cobalt-zinc-cadmium efflux system membrane fusion protein
VFTLKAGFLLTLAFVLTGCGARKPQDPAAGAPPAVQIDRESNSDVFQVEHADQVSLTSAREHVATDELKVNGSVNIDVSRAIPVVSVASGKITEIHARVGDRVQKGQLLLKVQSADISQAFSDYRQAQADETLAQTQLNRARLLYEKGATALKDLEVAQGVADKAVATVDATRARLRVLGADPANPAPIVEVVAPASGVITDQQVTAASGTQGLASPNLMTISDLSHVWIICDVYEDKLSFVQLGEYADVHVNAYPGLQIRGRISNISPILDPNLRTAKVRLEVANPNQILRLGMFATATFHSQAAIARAAVPSSAIMHLHDKDWVYVPLEGALFRRVEVVGGDMLPGKMQEVTGISPGQEVVQNALALQATAEQVAGGALSALTSDQSRKVER